MNYSFNLLERPWIPCRKSDGATEPLSIRETIARAPELLGIVHESPPVGVSVIRLLLAILHRVYGPATIDDWVHLWRSQSFHMPALDSYFARWRTRFDLFDGKRPFYQDASISPSLASPISKLMHAAASGNNATLFDHSLDDRCPAINAKEAALQLVAHQNYALGGLTTPDPAIPKSKYTEGSPTVKGALCVLRGGTLHETLLLNLRRYAPAHEVPFGSTQDLPAWERNDAVQVRERVPAGWLDLLTWQSRRIFLVPEGEASAPIVSRAAVMKGEAVLDSFALQGKDSMVAWRLFPKAAKGTNPWLPLGFREDRAVWRDAHSFFANFEDQSIRPPILNWIAELTDEFLDESCRYPLDVAGLCTNQAKILSWHFETLPLPLTILKQPSLCGQVGKALEFAENGEGALLFGSRRLAERLLVPQERIGGEKKAPDKKSVSRLIDSLLRRQHYWAGLQGGFQSFVVRLGAEGPQVIDVDTGLSPALAEWIRLCRQSAKDSMDLTCRAVGQGKRTFRAIADAERAFFSSLNHKLPNNESKQEVVEHDAAIAG